MASILFIDCLTDSDQYFSEVQQYIYNVYKTV